MPLTPLDIHKKEFTRSFRGYDEDEVNEFLDQLIKDYEAVLREKKTLFEQVTSLEEKLAHFNNIEETLNKAVLVAQETADDLRRNAEKEAQLIVKESEKNANRIVNEALMKSRKVMMETEEMKKQASVYKMRFKMLIEAQLEMLRSEDWDRVVDEEVEESGSTQEVPAK
ncbi:DivIVA domain-containing protein [Shouchella lonarensis]|uniref:Cell division initiation protein n=1 Tax=Shouchella lonarensis TaxID=1464122 RepID=A0A1G6KXF7_9BACI|nr:DivIVA domain-containing protein [Shouchella lonarensis]SDC35760.1 cell division initiation protein [Shouchella lonarensis]